MILIEYKSTTDWARSVAKAVAFDLREVLKIKGEASLVVPGGSTPGPVLEILAEQELNWSNIVVIPSDERCVPSTSERSNERMIRNTLIRSKAKKSRLISLYSPDTKIDGTDEMVQSALPISVCFLGMGEDLHIASLFPDSPELPKAIARNAPNAVRVSAPSQPEARVTLSLNVIQSSKRTHVLFKGSAKRAALEKNKHRLDDRAVPVSFIAPAATFHCIE